MRTPISDLMRTERGPRKRPLPDKLYAPKERDIQRTADDLLKLDGWRIIVTDPPQLRGLGVSEKGIPDRLYIRYRPSYEPYGQCTNIERLNPSLSEVLWIEWKRPGGKAGVRQQEWIAEERRRGALVWLAGVDFPATHDGFLDHYRKSGLNRRPI